MEVYQGTSNVQYMERASMPALPSAQPLAKYPTEHLAMVTDKPPAFSDTYAIVENTSGRARARVDALTDMLPTHHITVNHSRRHRRDGALWIDVTAPHSMYGGVQHLVDELVDEMEAAAGNATRDYGAWLRDQDEIDHMPAERPNLRRAWRRSFLRAWGLTYARRRLSCGEPVAAPVGETGARSRHYDAADHARRAVNQLPAGRLIRPVDEAEATAAAHSHAHVTVPASGDWLRDDARVWAVNTVLTAHDVVVSPPVRLTGPSRGRLRLRLDGHPAVLAYLVEHLEDLSTTMDRAAAAATHAYGRWQRTAAGEVSGPAGNRSAIRRAWRHTYLRAYAARYAARLYAARAGRGDADCGPDALGATVSGPCPTRCAYGDVDSLDADVFTVPAATVNATGTPATERLVIVPCGSAKQAQLAPAGEMYVGSYHQACRRAAAALIAAGGRALILSAKNGLLSLDEEIEPYEQRAGHPGSVTVTRLRQQSARLGLTAAADVVVLAGRDYSDLARAVWPHARLPLEGTGGIGEQLAVLARIAGAETAAETKGGEEG